MPTPLIRYALDTTGVSPDNFVQDEAVVLENRRIRAIAPIEGAFFGTSVKLIENTTGRTLTPGVHYSPAEYLRTASEMTGKRVYGIILVHDPAVSSHLTLSYQVIGGLFTGQTDTLKHLLEQHRHDGTEYGYYDVVGKPDEFDPTPHYHTLDDGMQFQYMTHALERIRNAILWADSPAIQDLYTFIETLLADLDAKLKNKADAYMSPLLLEFRRTITKATIGLDKVENLRVATQAEGTKAGLLETKIQDFLERKYIALDAIVAFKDSLYNSLVSKDTTNLGRTAATFIPPRKQSLFNLPNGAVVTFLSRREALATIDGFEQSCYPPNINDDTRITVQKVVNNRNNRGGIFLAYTMDGTKAYIGQHSSGVVTEDISWRRFLFTEDLKVFTDLLSAHIANTNNPHKVRKDQVGLSEVENLPVITREEILCLKSVRKYMTFDAFLLFMKAFMIGKNGSSADPGAEDGEPLENCQIIYCPCAPCGCGPSSSTPPPSYPPSGQEISWSCRGFDKWGLYHNGSGGTYDQIIANNSPECGWQPPATPPPADVLLGWRCVGSDKVGRYSDGKGGTYENLILANSPECGAAPPGPTPGPTPPPPAGEPFITLAFSVSTVRVGTPNAAPAVVQAKQLTPGKKYGIGYKVKFENQPGYVAWGIGGGEFTASSVERVLNESFLNEGNAYPGRLAVVAVLMDIATGRMYESQPAYVTLIIDKAIDFAINGIRTGADLPAGQSVNVTAAFKDWPINTDINWALYIWENSGALIQTRMDSLGVGNYATAVIPVDANFRGAVKYKIVGRWAVPAQAGGGVRELASNVVTINWTGPGNSCLPAGQHAASECQGPNLVGTYHNGNCGTYTQVVEYNSPTCIGSPPATPPPPTTPPPSNSPPPPPGNETIQKAITYTVSMRGAGSSYQGQIQAIWNSQGETVTISGPRAAILQLTASGQASVGGGVVRSFQQNYFAGMQGWDSEPMVYYFVPKAAFLASDFELYFEGDYYGSQP